MAESVQYYLERMIPELEGLEKKKIFSPVKSQLTLLTWRTIDSLTCVY